VPFGVCFFGREATAQIHLSLLASPLAWRERQGRPALPPLTAPSMII
jgi:hypothetical protein